MRLGLSLCVPHNCHCKTLVDAQGLPAMVCKKAPGKITRHHVFNDIIWRAVGAAGIPAVSGVTVSLQAPRLDLVGGPTSTFS